MDGYTQSTMTGAGLTDHESASKMMQQPAAPVAAEAGWKVDTVSVRQAANGGFIVSCQKSRETGPEDKGPSWESKDYSFSSIDEVVSFLGQEFGAAPAADAGTRSGLAPSMPQAGV